MKRQEHKRQYKAIQDKTRQEHIIQYNTIHAKTRQYYPRYDKTIREQSTRQDKTIQGNS